MNARWMKALAFLAAAGATAAVMAKSRRDPSWLRVEPTFEDEPVSAPPIPSSAESDRALAAADAARPSGSTLPAEAATDVPSTPKVDLAAEVAEAEKPAESPAPAETALDAPPTLVADLAPKAAEAERPAESRTADEATPARVENAGGSAAISAREAAVLFAHDAIHDRAVAGERVVCLAVGDVREVELEGGRAHIIVPLELSHRSEGRLPQTRAATLHVLLEGGPTDWRIASHSWE